MTQMHKSDVVAIRQAEPAEPILLAPADVVEGRRVWSPEIPRFAAIGGAFGLALLGGLGWLVGNGTMPVSGIGQFAASGPFFSALAAGGVGAALGGTLLAALAVLRLDRYHRSGRRN